METVTRALSFVLVLFCLSPPAGAFEIEPDSRIREALQRGMMYMIESAMDPGHFEEYCSDYLFFFADVSRMPDPWIREQAVWYGQFLGGLYLEEHFSLEDANDVVDAASALYSLDFLGLNVDAAMAALFLGAMQFPVEDYWGFDPSRGETTDLDHLIDLLIGFHFTDRIGLDPGVSFAEALLYVPTVEYSSDCEVGEGRHIDQNNLVTHLIYTYSGYATRLIDPTLVPRELEYIREQMPAALVWADPETLSEYVDSLQLMGYGREDPDVEAGIEVLLAIQKPDGRWEPEDPDDEYDRYHATWCAMDALRSYAPDTELGPEDSLVKELLDRWAAQGKAGMAMDPAVPIGPDKEEAEEEEEPLQ
jgi:hypothetical protein